MSSKSRIAFKSFIAGQFLDAYYSQFPKRVDYFRQYLQHCEAKTILEESIYFDRDFLAEFSSFYASTSGSYKNYCRRIHLFSEVSAKEIFWKAVGGDEESKKQLSEAYLGFIVIRPIPHAPFGRTVLKWYEKNQDARNTECSRLYAAHIAGIRLEVRGLAWQQQDQCVSTCATVALWSMLHSSAFDDFHEVPTTTHITQFAHSALPDGKMTFPSNGLSMEQIGEAIKSYGLCPSIMSGESTIPGNHWPTFSKTRLSTVLAGFLRSGYPVLIYGMQTNNILKREDPPLHTVCSVGFKEAALRPRKAKETWRWQDADVDVIYLHDDNLGPNVRFEIIEDIKTKKAYLLPKKPPYVEGDDIFKDVARFYPSYIVAATHQELRSDPRTLTLKGSDIVDGFDLFLRTELKENSDPVMKEKIEIILKEGLLLATSFMKLTKFFDKELSHFFGKQNAGLLKSVRKELAEKLPPMSLHLGVIKIGIGKVPAVDILCDTSEPQLNAFGHIVYHPLVGKLIELYADVENLHLGRQIKAYRLPKTKLNAKKSKKS